MTADDQAFDTLFAALQDIRDGRVRSTHVRGFARQTLEQVNELVHEGAAEEFAAKADQ